MTELSVKAQYAYRVPDPVLMRHDYDEYGVLYMWDAWKSETPEPIKRKYERMPYYQAAYALCMLSGFLLICYIISL